MLRINNLKPVPKSIKKRKRIGRGEASGHGKTSGRGHKGALSRAGTKKRHWFEGGQMPLHRRLPKKGFHNPFKKHYEIVNLWQLNKFQEVKEITPEKLKETGIISGKYPVKLLSNGELKKPFKIKVHSFSEKAQKKVEEAGGIIEVIS